MWLLDLLRPVPMATTVPEALIGETYRRRRIHLFVAVYLGMTVILIQNVADLHVTLWQAGIPITTI